jgi:HK97 family phage prohead protease
MEKVILTTKASDCRFELKPRKKFDGATQMPVVPEPPELDDEAEGLPPETEELPILIGYAIKWDDISDDRGGYHAKFDAKGFQPDAGGMLALFGHDLNMPMGNTNNGTLEYTADEYGLQVTITPPNTSYAKDAVELVGKKYVQGMSFGMYPSKWDDSEDEMGRTIRTYTEYTVDEVSITAGPAFKSTSIGLELAKADLNRQALELDLMELEVLTLN